MRRGEKRYVKCNPKAKLNIHRSHTYIFHFELLRFQYISLLLFMCYYKIKARREIYGRLELKRLISPESLMAFFIDNNTMIVAAEGVPLDAQRKQQKTKNRKKTYRTSPQTLPKSAAEQPTKSSSVSATNNFIQHNNIIIIILGLMGVYDWILPHREP